MEIGIIDYRAGNAPSVLNAFKKLNIPAKLITNPKELDKFSALVLPGVGSARATMESLKEMGFINALNEAVNINYISFLGICVGMQILFEYSEEDGVFCLGWLKGKVKKFGNNVRIPQIGWNNADFKKEDLLIKNCQNPEYFYFVNSFYTEPQDESIVLSTTDYGNVFCSSIRFKNIAATQFHLEKSGEAGLKILRNFANSAVLK